MVRRVEELSIRKRRRNKSPVRQIKKKKKVVAKEEKRLVTYAETFDEMLAKSQLSASKQILNELFPMTIHKNNPISNNTLYSGMLVDPDYMDNIKLSIPGEYKSISVREYMNSLGVELDYSDPYTYSLAKHLKSSFEKDMQLKLSRQILNKHQNISNKRWNSVR